MSKEEELKELEEKLLRITQSEKINGILVYKLIKCGKKGCCCEDGKKHGPYLHLQSYDKKTKKIKTKYIKKSEEIEYKKKYADNKEYYKILNRIIKLKKSEK